jgi:ribosomal protein S12 methylthiotransferase
MPTPLSPTIKDDSPVSIGFISLGCAKNLVDSQHMAGALISEGMVLAPTPEQADIVVVNTCAFIEDAREESAEMIMAACALKTQGRCRGVLVAGCMPQRYRDSIATSFPDVDAFIGLDEIPRIPAIAREMLAGKHGIIEVSDHSTALFEPQRQVVFTGGPYAYLKIAEGCNHRCAFCAIPGIRGKHRSRQAELVAEEAAQLVNSGFHELNIISQDVTTYGSDLPAPTTLAKLVTEIAAIEGDFWLRLLYGYPSTVTTELLEAMASSPKVCRYLDIPIQHAHPEVLKAMHRADTIAHVPSLAARIRSALPGAAVRTTCLVGFPGETDAHFDYLLDFVRETKFDHLGVFAYSPEEGTPAFGRADVPPAAVAQERRNRLMAAQLEIVEKLAARRHESDATFLLESPTGPNDGSWRARARFQAPEVDGFTLLEDVPESAQLGDIVKGRITAHDAYDYIADYQA